MMQPDSNQFREVSQDLYDKIQARPDSEAFCGFKCGEHLVIRNYEFVVNKIDTLSKPHRLILVPVGPVSVAEQVVTTTCGDKSRAVRSRLPWVRRNDPHRQERKAMKSPKSAYLAIALLCALTGMAILVILFNA